VLILLLIPAMQVAVVRFINPPLTLPMLIEQGGATFSSAPKRPLLYRWIALPQIPEMSLEHLWISEDQRFFQHEGFDWKEMDLAMKEAERKKKPVRGASTITNQCARSIFLLQGRSWIRKGLESYCMFSRSARQNFQRMPLSAVQFTLVIWPATTSASKRQRPIRGGAPSL
jgi:monofunctional biosynthetic peptidoglycan transglycosylase